jgi:hypothetical protein
LNININNPFFGRAGGAFCISIGGVLKNGAFYGMLRYLFSIAGDVSEADYFALETASK